jgi:uncharacterized protein (DUF849 family)
MLIDMNNQKKVPPDTEACHEKVASQEEIYLETTEEELRSDLTSEPIVAEQLRRNREKLEVDWELEIFDDRCK